MINYYTLEKNDDWDNIVKSFENYDVYYLSGYVRAFQINGEGDPILVYYEDGITRAINVVIRRDISKCEYFNKSLRTGEWFDVVTPYGYGGFLVEGNDYEKLCKEYIQFCCDNNIVCEFVRFHPLLSNWTSVEVLYKDIHLGDTVYIDTKSEEQIWKNFSSKNRNVIRKAQKAGLEVFWCRDPKIIKPFIEIYNATMDKDQASEYYYFKEKFYQSILSDLKHNAMWFYALSNGEIAAISIFMFCNKNMHYHLSASQKKYQSFAPTNLLIYEAALWANKNGYERLHLGGGVGSGHDSLYKFKKAFNRGEDLEFHIGKRIFNKKKYKELCEMREILLEENTLYDGYFPKYRGRLEKYIGDFNELMI